MEFKDYVRILLSHWVGVVLLTVLGVAGAFVYNATQPQVYEASATGLLTVGKTDSTSAATIGDQLAKNRVTSYVAVATTTQVADTVIDSGALDDTDLPSTPGALIGHVSVSHDEDTVLITIATRASKPEYAAILANAWVDALAQQVEAIDGARQATPDAADSSDPTENQGLKMVTLTQAAPGHLVLPRTSLNLLVGLIVGALLGFVYALVRHQFDRRLRSSEDVEKQFGIPVIGMIPQSSHMRQSCSTGPADDARPTRRAGRRRRRGPARAGLPRGGRVERGSRA